jgi:hypothetical protein
MARFAANSSHLFAIWPAISMSLIGPDPRLADKPVARLNPELIVNGAPLVLMTQLLAPIPVKLLKDPVANLNNQFDIIANAMDMLFKGF